MEKLVTTRNLLVLVIILITVWLAVPPLRNYRVSGPEATLVLLPDNVDLALKNIKYTKTRDGETLWTLVADSADHSMDDGITRIENVRMVFFDAEMGDIVLTADQGELISEGRGVKIHSNVKIVRPSGNEMLTEFLEYKESDNSLHTDKEVCLYFDHFDAVGKGMRLDLKKRELILLSNVKANFES